MTYQEKLELYDKLLVDFETNFGEDKFLEMIEHLMYKNDLTYAIKLLKFYNGRLL